MKDLAEDRDEVDNPAQRRWIGRARRRYGIRADEPTTWTVEVEQSWLDPEHSESAVVDILRSPGDALASAEARSSNAAHRDGIGSWTLEVFGDGVNGPRRLVVRPHADDEPTTPEAGDDVPAVRALRYGVVPAEPIDNSAEAVNARRAMFTGFGWGEEAPATPPREPSSSPSRPPARP